MKFIRKLMLFLLLSVLLCYPSSAWLSGYDYRMPIEINNTGNNLTHYQYNFTANTTLLVSTGKINANGSDCSITNSTDILQSFWNETVFNDSSTKIWVNGSSLGNATNTTHYMYYGKSGANSLTNGSATFNFFDSFSVDTHIKVSESTNPTRTADDAWEGTALNEQSDFNYGGEYISWYRGNLSTNKNIGFENSTDGVSWLAYSGNPIMTVGDGFPYVVQDDDCFYMFISLYGESYANVYLYNVTDYTNPVIMNGGNPVLTESEAWEGSEIYNMAVEIDSNNVWHMLYECPGEKVGYAYSNFTELNWTIHKSTNNPLFTSSGNPYLKHVPDRNALFVLMGYRPATYWTIKAKTVNLSTDLDVAANWITAPNFEISHSSIHTADPHAMFNFNSTYPTMISYNYNQVEVYQIYYTSTLNEFYDNIIGDVLFDKWQSTEQARYITSNGLLAMTVPSAATKLLNSKDTFNDFIVEGRMKTISTDGYTFFALEPNVADWDHTEYVSIREGITGQVYMGGTYSNVGSIISNTWYKVKMDLPNTGDGTSYLYYDNSTLIGSYTATPTARTHHLAFHQWNANTGYVDWVFVRDFATVEPTASLGVEESMPPPIITLLSQTPSIIYTNSTGCINISYGITHGTQGINNTSVSFIYRNYDYDLSDSNHSIRPPTNNLASEWNFDGRILRAANRNETPGLNFENNDTITGADTYTWSGLDENSTKLTIVPVNSTYTKVYINATVHCIMPQMWYLDRTDQQQAAKTQLAIHKTSNVLIKFWNFEIYKGNYDFLGVGYTDTLLSSNPALWPSDANPINFYYVNSSYDPATGGDPITSGYAVYMGSLNASGWVDHAYSRSDSNYVRGFIDNNYLHTIVDTTNISYLYFTSNTESSKPYYINMTNVASSTNVSFANTNTLWAGNTPPYTPQAYTPNVWFAFMKLNMSLDYKLYAADNNYLWGVSSMNRTNITQALFPPTTPVIDHFHFLGETNYDMDGVYYGNFSIGCGVSTDPDGGDVTHNLTLHYANNLTFVTIINNTFTDKDITHNGVYFDANFSSIPYYSDDVNYTLRLIATDDESESVTVWLGVNFTLSITPIITSYTPSTPATTIQHDTQEFTINISQIVNVTWYIDGSVVSIINNTNYSTYSNSTATIGTYNVTAYVENVNGTRQQVWEWEVEDPVFAALLQLQADIDKMKKTQTIIQALIFLVIGVVVGVVAQRRRFNDEDSEKSIESKNN